MLRARVPHWRIAVAAWLTTLMVCMTGAADARPPKAYIVIDASSGQALVESRPDMVVHPASLTKMMTLYLAFDALRAGKIELSSRVKMSRRAARQPPSKLGVPAGRTISLRTAILALSVKSANDVAVAVAERLAGSEKAFARQMNAKARALGMARTNFVNASGLHHSRQVSTPRDLARLSRGLIYKHGAYFDNFSATSFKYGGRNYRTHNRFVLKYKGADGIKTGYVNASGFNLAGSAVRNGRRLIGVIVGGRSSARRDRDLMRLMDSGFVAAKPLRKPRFAGIAPVGVDWRTGAPHLPRRRPGSAPPPLPAALVAMAQTAPSMPVDIPRRPEADANGAYSAQVGAVASKSAAANLASKQLKALGAAVSGGEPTVAELRLKSGRRLYRARIAGLTSDQARAACATLKRKGRDCLVVAASG